MPKASIEVINYSLRPKLKGFVSAVDKWLLSVDQESFIFRDGRGQMVSEMR
jgi:hypothetical protein